MRREIPLVQRDVGTVTGVDCGGAGGTDGVPGAAHGMKGIVVHHHISVKLHD
jgi:hypothetical protein